MQFNSIQYINYIKINRLNRLLYFIVSLKFLPIMNLYFSLYNNLIKTTVDPF